MPNGTYGGVRGQVNTKVGDKHPMISVYLLLDCSHEMKMLGGVMWAHRKSVDVANVGG